MNSARIQQEPFKRSPQSSITVPACRLRAVRRCKSDDREGGLRHLIDYSTTRATHDATSRSQCRGPIIGRKLYEPGTSSIVKSITARDLDWNILSSTMDMSNDEFDSPRNDERTQLERPDFIRQGSCSANLRINLAKIASFRGANSSHAFAGESRMDSILKNDSAFWKEDLEESEGAELRSNFVRSKSLLFRRSSLTAKSGLRA